MTMILIQRELSDGIIAHTLAVDSALRSKSDRPLYSRNE
jgi:hypothetical protein